MAHVMSAVTAQQYHHGQLWPAAQGLSTAEQLKICGGKLDLSSEIHSSSNWEYSVGCGGSVGFQRSRLRLCIMIWSCPVRLPSPIISDRHLTLSVSHPQSEKWTHSHYLQRGCLCGCTQELHLSSATPPETFMVCISIIHCNPCCCCC